MAAWFVSVLMVILKVSRVCGQVVLQELVDRNVSVMDRRWVKANGGKRCCPCPHCGSWVWSYQGAVPKERGWLEVFGAIRMGRHWARCGQCQKPFFPLDSLLGLGRHREFPLLQRACVILGVHVAPRVAVEMLELLVGIRLCANTVAARVKELGRAAIERQEGDMALEVGLLEQAVVGQEGPLELCVGLDGGMVPLNELPKDEEGSHKEARVATLTLRNARGERLKKIVLARLTDLSVFLSSLRILVEETREVLPNLRRVSFHTDGARWIGTFLEALSFQVCWILDWYHLKEKVWSLKEVLGSGATPRRLQTLHRVEDALWVGKVEEALCVLRTMRFHYGFQRAARDTVVAYIRERKDRIPNYQWLSQRSMTIGSGEVEGAIKHVIHNRLRCAGMRWSAEGADALISARCSLLNGTWEHDLLQANLAA